jgi:hypothetical protein
MKPAENTRVHRRALRIASKGMSRGRRTTHQVEINLPRAGSSTWLRRHLWQEDARTYYREMAR